jgi:hypothetical protein
MYSVRKKNIGRKPAAVTSCVASATATLLTRRIGIGTSGLDTNRSLTAKATSAAPASARPPIVQAAPQPTSGAFTSE